jgi:hypothetical protein
VNGVRVAVILIALAIVLAGCGGDKSERQVCGGPRNTSLPRTTVTVWLRPHTDEDTVRGVACQLEQNPLVASVFVTPGEPPEPSLFRPGLGPLPPGMIEATPRRANDAGRIRAYVHRFPNAQLVDDVIISRVD